MRLIPLLILVVLKFMMTAACAGDRVISTPEELLHALKFAKGGERLVLKPGNYGQLFLSGKNNFLFQYSSPVTIVSQSLGNRSIFQKVRLEGVKNLRFDQLIFDYKYATGDAVYAKTFTITNSNSLSIVNSIFDGDNVTGTRSPADGFGTGIGLAVGDSSQIIIDGNVFFTWHRGATFGRTNELIINKNEFRDLRSDGLNFVAVKDVVIEHNYIHDFRRSLSAGDHADMIQFWTYKAKYPTTNVVISENILDVGRGDPTQSVFMRNEMVDQALAGPEMYYKNIVIKGNIIRNGHSHGITVGEAIGLSIESNTIIQLPTSKGAVAIPSINITEKAKDVKVIGNVTPRIGTSLKMAQLGWEIRSNFFTQLNEPSLPTNYRSVFVNAEGSKNEAGTDLRFLPSSQPAILGLGSPLSHFDVHPKTLDGFILHRAMSRDDKKQEFDASHIYGSAGKLDTRNAKATWSFGDGVTQDGILTQHVYAEAGEYLVKAKITLGNGQKISLSKAVIIGENH